MSSIIEKSVMKPVIEVSLRVGEQKMIHDGIRVRIENWEWNDSYRVEIAKFNENISAFEIIQDIDNLDEEMVPWDETCVTREFDFATIIVNIDR